MSDIREYYEMLIFTRSESVPFGLSCRLTFSSFDIATESASVFKDKFGVSPKINKIICGISEVKNENTKK